MNALFEGMKAEVMRYLGDKITEGDAEWVAEVILDEGDLWSEIHEKFDDILKNAEAEK